MVVVTYYEKKIEGIESPKVGWVTFIGRVEEGFSEEMICEQRPEEVKK